jgi:hypothetical protein
VSIANETAIDPALYAELGYTPQWKYDFVDGQGAVITAVK